MNSIIIGFLLTLVSGSRYHRSRNQEERGSHTEYSGNIHISSEPEHFSKYDIHHQQDELSYIYKKPHHRPSYYVTASHYEFDYKLSKTVPTKYQSDVVHKPRQTDGNYSKDFEYQRPKARVEVYPTDIPIITKKPYKKYEGDTKPKPSDVKSSEPNEYKEKTEGEKLVDEKNYPKKKVEEPKPKDNKQKTDEPKPKDTIEKIDGTKPKAIKEIPEESEPKYIEEKPVESKPTNPKEKPAELKPKDTEENPDDSKSEETYEKPVESTPIDVKKKLEEPKPEETREIEPKKEEKEPYEFIDIEYETIEHSPKKEAHTKRETSETPEASKKSETPIEIEDPAEKKLEEVTSEVGMNPYYSVTINNNTLLPVLSHVGSPKEAYRLTSLATMAYCSDESLEEMSCRACKKVGDGLEVQKIFYDPNTAGRALSAIDDSRKQILLSFRGSITLTNWITNLQLNLKPGSFNPEVKVHRGFSDAYESLKPIFDSSIKEMLEEYLPKNYTFLVVGHSLGGALASLAAIDLQNRYQIPFNQMKVYTYGQPRTGDKAFANLVNSKPWSYTRVVNFDDIVPHLPLARDGYAHCATELHIENLEASACKSDVEFEDPNCSNRLYPSYGVFSHLKAWDLALGLFGC